MKTTLKELNTEIVSCRLCPRLVAWREEVARTKRAGFRDWEYWGKPVPGFGDPEARLLIVGLAPAAHGANRTGRMFTGDKSGDWLYEALHRFGYANHAKSESRTDGLVLRDCYITASVRCAPPQNRPEKVEFDTCRPYLLKELRIMRNIRVIVALGKIAFDTVISCSRILGWNDFVPKPAFMHGQQVKIMENLYLIGSYHPSQQNTFTGRLTREMFWRVFRMAEIKLKV
jgi:uracil-DNA glycosylase